MYFFLSFYLLYNELKWVIFNRFLELINIIKRKLSVLNNLFMFNFLIQDSEVTSAVLNSLCQWFLK